MTVTANFPYIELKFGVTVALTHTQLCTTHYAKSLYFSINYQNQSSLCVSKMNQ